MAKVEHPRAIQSPTVLAAFRSTSWTSRSRNGILRCSAGKRAWMPRSMPASSASSSSENLKRGTTIFANRCSY